MKPSRHRWLRRGVIVALVTPLLTLIFGVVSIADTSRDTATGQPNLRAAIVNNDQLSLTDPTLAQSGLAGRVLVGELVTATDSGFTWDITNKETAEAGLADGTYAAIVTIPENFTSAFLSSTTDNPEQATLSVQTDGSQSYIAALLARALAANLQSSVSTALTELFVDTLLISFTGLSDGLGDISQAAGALELGLSDMTEISSVLPELTNDLASGSRLVSDGVYLLGDALWSLGNFTNEQVTETGQLSTDISTLRAYVTANLPDGAQKTQILSQLDALTLNADLLALKALESSLAVDAGALAADVIGDGASAVADGSQILTEGMPLFTEGLAGATEGTGLLAEGLETISEALPQFSQQQAQKLAEVVAQPVTTDLSSSPPLPSAVAAVTAFVAPMALWLGALVLSLVYAPYEARALRTRASTLRIVWGASIPPAILSIIQALLVIGAILIFGVTPTHHLAFFALVILSSLSFVLLHQGLTAIAGRSAWLASIALFGLQVVAAGVLVPSQYLPSWMSSLGAILPLSQSIQASQAFLNGGSVSVGAGALFSLVLTAALGFLLLAINVAQHRKIRSNTIQPVSTS